MIREKLELRRQDRQKKKRKKLFFSVITCLMIGFISLGVYAGFNYLHKPTKNYSAKINSKTTDEQPKKSETILPTLDTPMTIMLLGVDQRKDDVGRSDTLMIANVSGSRASLLSVPRDTRVYIERHGYQKINAAYAFGGEKLTQQTVEDFLGIKIEHYVTVDTKKFGKLIDALGGIDVYVEKEMHYEDPWDDNGGLVIDVDKGWQHLDGETAIQFVRFRDSEGDAGRVRRQQAFMKACAEKITEPAMILKLPEVLSTISAAVKTDLTYSEMLALAGSLKNAENNSEIKTGVVPGYWQYIDGVSYLLPNVRRLGEVMNYNLDMKVGKSHFEKLEDEYPPIYTEDIYDVNPDPKKDLRIMNQFERDEYDLSANKL